MTTLAAEPLEELSLPVLGMTCASCVTRIERFLGRAEGVADATVNLATERATVHFDPRRIDRGGLVAAIVAAGYEVAHETATGVEAADEADAARASERRALLRDALLATAIGLAMMAVSLWPGGAPWPMDRINVWMLAPATVVQFVFGRRFLASAARGLRHGDLTMDTLVSLGTLAAYGYSLAVTLAGTAAETYFDSAAVIIGLVLLGRWLCRAATLRDPSRRRQGAAQAAADHRTRAARRARIRPADRPGAAR